MTSASLVRYDQYGLFHVTDDAILTAISGGQNIVCAGNGLNPVCPNVCNVTNPVCIHTPVVGNVGCNPLATCAPNTVCLTDSVCLPALPQVGCLLPDATCNLNLQCGCTLQTC